jgi:ELWxxDGT repeat protein
MHPSRRVRVVSLVALLATSSLAAQTLVKDIWPQPQGSGPYELTRLRDRLFFAADDGVTGVELWSSDGTSAGTVQVADLVPGRENSRPLDLVPFRERLFFAAASSATRAAIWQSDGTAAGTTPVREFTRTSAWFTLMLLTPVGATLFFTADDVATGRELWQSDGTKAGTTLVADLAPGPASSNPNSLTPLGGAVLFIAEPAPGVWHLWRSDGTAAGTTSLAQLFGYSYPFARVGPQILAVVGGTAFFLSNHPSGADLWKTDGTAAGTLPVKDLGVVLLNQLEAAAVGGTLFFAHTDYSRGGRELWKSDGTDAGTVLVKDLHPVHSQPENLVAAGGLLFFTADDGVHGRELWTSDGTAAGTVLVTDLTPGAGGTEFYAIAPAGAGTRVVFAATHPQYGAEVFRSDGTAAGTVLVADVAPGGSSSWAGIFSGFERVGTRIFFSADDRTTGLELHAVPLAAAGGSLAEPFGAGCAGTGARVPALAATGVPATGGSITASVRDARPGAAVLLGISPQGLRVPWGNGCESYLGLPLSFVLGASNAGGVASFPLPIPDDLSLRGAELRAQGFVVDPGGAFRSALAFSNGLHVLIGE